MPHWLAWHVLGVHTSGAAHTLFPPHVSGAVQVPQLSAPPQPSGGVPQFAPRVWHVVGVHPQTLDVHMSSGFVHPPH
jgi:hypothetical protein